MSADRAATADRQGTGERIVVRKHVSASRAEVFAAWTEADQMKQWMRPGGTTHTDVVLDARVGGAFTIDMFDGGRKHAHWGEFVTVEPPAKLAFTWNAEWLPDGSLVTVELFDRDGGTEVVLTHERFPTADLARNHEQGWGQILDRLAGVFSQD